MAMETRDLIDIIAPALRALLAEGETLKIVRFEEGVSESDDAMTFEPPADADAAPSANANAIAPTRMCFSDLDRPLILSLLLIYCDTVNPRVWDPFF